MTRLLLAVAAGVAAGWATGKYLLTDERKAKILASESKWDNHLISAGPAAAAALTGVLVYRA